MGKTESAAVAATWTSRADDDEDDDSDDSFIHVTSLHRQKRCLRLWWRVLL